MHTVQNVSITGMQKNSQGHQQELASQLSDDEQLLLEEARYNSHHLHGSRNHL